MEDAVEHFPDALADLLRYGAAFLPRFKRVDEEAFVQRFAKFSFVGPLRADTVLPSSLANQPAGPPPMPAAGANAAREAVIRMKDGPVRAADVPPQFKSGYRPDAGSKGKAKAAPPPFETVTRQTSAVVGDDGPSTRMATRLAAKGGATSSAPAPTLSPDRKRRRVEEVSPPLIARSASQPSPSTSGLFSPAPRVLEPVRPSVPSSLDLHVFALRRTYNESLYRLWALAAGLQGIRDEETTATGQPFGSYVPVTLPAVDRESAVVMNMDDVAESVKVRASESQREVFGLQ